MSTPEPGTSYTAAFLVPGSILLGLALLISFIRFYCRCRPVWLLKWDDYTLAFSLLLTVPWFVLICVLYSSYGRGVVSDRQPNLFIVGPLELAVGLLWSWAMNVIRISMCLMILRLKASDSRAWKWSLWGLIAVQVSMIVSATILNLSYCRPATAAWVPRPDTVCWKPSVLKIFAYTYNSLNVASDLILSLIPLAFITKIHRPLSEKLLIYCLMAAGLVASVFGVLRLVILVAEFGPMNPAWVQVKSDVLCGLELMVATIAASLPCLKAPAHRAMRRMGFFHKPPSIDASPNSFLRHMTYGSHIRQQIDELPLTNPPPLYLPQYSRSSEGR